MITLNLVSSYYKYETNNFPFLLVGGSSERCIHKILCSYSWWLALHNPESAFRPSFVNVFQFSADQITEKGFIWNFRPFLQFNQFLVVKIFFSCRGQTKLHLLSIKFSWNGCNCKEVHAIIIQTTHQFYSLHPYSTYMYVRILVPYTITPADICFLRSDSILTKLQMPIIVSGSREGKL